MRQRGEAYTDRHGRLIWPDLSGNGHDLIMDPIPFVGDIAEAYIFSEPITREQRELIEGYLAAKHNGLHYLPVDHRYSPWAGSPCIVKQIVKAWRWMNRLVRRR